MSYNILYNTGTEGVELYNTRPARKDRPGNVAEVRMVQRGERPETVSGRGLAAFLRGVFPESEQFERQIRWIEEEAMSIGRGWVCQEQVRDWPRFWRMRGCGADALWTTQGVFWPVCAAHRVRLQREGKALVWLGRLGR